MPDRPAGLACRDHSETHFNPWSRVQSQAPHPRTADQPQKLHQRKNGSLAHGEGEGLAVIHRGNRDATPMSAPSSLNRSEAETGTDGRSKVVVVVIGHAGAVRNGDGQTTGDVGIRNSAKNVETLGEVVIRIE